MHTTPELLAPAGSRESFLAALDSGADAIYLGSGRLNARGDKAQFTQEELRELVDLAHKRGAKVYLTLNILLHDEELEEAVALASFAHEIGVDACIVQDRGLMRCLARRIPELAVHASTQCTAGTEEAIVAYAALGCRRVVLPRELAIEEIRELTAFAHERKIETEVFIHGALCVSVSGQCHMSHFMGGRSANRGDCAQSCRMSYRILRNGEAFRGEGPWLSPKDLGAFTILNKVMETGVDSLKIEGRLRRPDYVGQVTAVYRSALAELAKQLQPVSVLTEDRERSLLVAFNRGGAFNQQFWSDRRDKNFLSGPHTGHQGVFLGVVSEVKADKGSLEFFRSPALPPDYLPQPGSQITLRLPDGSAAASAPCGVVAAGDMSRTIRLQGFHPQILRKLSLPLDVWQMSQVSVPEQAAKGRERRKTPLSITLTQDSAGRIVLRLNEASKEIEVDERVLDPAPGVTEKEISAERCREQLSKLGDSPYTTGDITIEKCPAWRISDLNRLRRSALAELGKIRPAKLQETVAAAETRTKQFAYQDWPLIVTLPFWRLGESIPAVLAAEPLLLLLPAGELAGLDAAGFTELSQKLHAKSGIGALLPPERIPEVAAFIEQGLQRLHTAGLQALAAGPSGLPGLADRLGLKSLALISWQGNHLWNRESARALAAEGFTHGLPSPELEAPESADLAEWIGVETDMHALLWAYGRTQSMFTRFCPVGFSRGAEGCTLCREAQFSFADGRDRVFPLRPRRELACAFEVWQSEALPLTPVISRVLAKNANITPLVVFTDESEGRMADILRELRR